MERETVLMLGSNVGDSEKTLSQALRLIESEVGKVIKESSIYETDAWGIEDQAKFYNQGLVVSTNLTSLELLKTVLKIELILGRDRIKEVKWGERAIDIDIIFIGNEIYSSDDLTIPHPFMQKRNFVLVPLLEICPNFTHPLLGLTIEELNKKCDDELFVKKLKN